MVHPSSDSDDRGDQLHAPLQVHSTFLHHIQNPYQGIKMLLTREIYHPPDIYCKVTKSPVNQPQLSDERFSLIFLNFVACKYW